MRQTFHFYIGLHRSGGTVLSSILSQNPKVYVTSNTALYDVLAGANKTWNEAASVITHPIPEQLANMNKAIVESMWCHRPEPIIIDRNRNWSHSMAASSKWFDKDIKAIASTRDIPGIMASWITLYKRENEGYSQSDIERFAFHMWNSYTKEYVDSFVKMKREAGDRVFFFSYDEITSNPRYYLSRIEHFLGIPHYDYDLENIHGDFQDTNIIPESFEGLHRIRPKYEKASIPPEEELGPKLYKKFLELDEHFKSELHHGNYQ